MRGVLWIPGVAVAASAVVAVTRLILMAGRGLDFTDEGMYLLSADSQSRTASFHNAFGRYTGVLYQLVGHDVARFRVLGILTLVMAAGLLGDRVTVATARLGGRSCLHEERLLGAAAVVLASLHYYYFALATPSYNWLNLVGILLLFAAILDLATEPADRAHRWASWSMSAVFVAGFAIAMMGKVSSGPMIGFVGVASILLIRQGSLRARGACFVRMVPAAVGMLLIHSAVANPPWVTLEQTIRGSRALIVLDPVYGVSEAVGNMVSATLKQVSDLFRPLGRAVVPVAAGAALSIYGPTRWRRWGAPIASLGLVYGLLQLFHYGLWRGGMGVFGTLELIPLSILGLSLPFLLLVGREASAFNSRAAAITAILAVCGIAAGASYAFGSNNGFGYQLAGALGPMVAAALVVLFAVRGMGPLSVPAIILAVALSFGTQTMLTEAFNAPYRQAPLARDTTPIRIGPGGGTLLVAPEIATFVTDLRHAADRAGWKPGTPMMDFSEYSATTLYLLAAKPPPTILISVGNFSTADDLAKFSLDQIVEKGQRALWRRAWVLTLDPGSQGSHAPNPALLSRIGRSFPRDYERVGNFKLGAQRLTLWQPTTGAK